MQSPPRISPFVPLAVAAAGIAGWLVRGVVEPPRTRSVSPSLSPATDPRRESQRERERQLLESVVRRLQRLGRAGQFRDVDRWTEEICANGNCVDRIRMLRAEALLMERNNDGFATEMAAVARARARRIVNADLDPDHVDDPATFTGAEMLVLTGREMEYAAHRAALFGGVRPAALDPLVALRLARGALLLPGPAAEFAPALRIAESTLSRVDGPDRRRAQRVLAWAHLRSRQGARAASMARAVVQSNNDQVALAIQALAAHQRGNRSEFIRLSSRFRNTVRLSFGDNDPERWVLLLLADEVLRAGERPAGTPDPRESRLAPPPDINRSMVPAEVPMGAGQGVAIPAPRATVR